MLLRRPKIPFYRSIVGVLLGGSICWYLAKTIRNRASKPSTTSSGSDVHNTELRDFYYMGRESSTDNRATKISDKSS